MEEEARERHRHVIVLAVVLSLILVVVFSVSYEMKPQGAVISGAVIQEFSEQETVRVIVNFKESEEIKSASIRHAMNARALEREKDNIKEDIIGDKIRYDFGESVSAELTKSEVDVLAESKAVESVELVGKREIFLNESVLIVDAVNAGKLRINGISLTGLGQTVCVIDTGIDYTHPDLGGCFGSECKVAGGYDFANKDENPIDDHNHGTHVAGIIAANGAVRGVAPDAKLIAIKVCTSKGVCYDDDIIAGIRWCVNNSLKFNISAISMSLGGGLYENYCNDDPLSPVINEAVGQNITMVVASGNYGSKTAISAPACVESVLAVGSTTKSDGMSSFSNRNKLLKIVAPGSNIYSTIINGHGTYSGTSMATPHASGVVALINQYLSLTGEKKTPGEIKNVLTNSGKIINDSGGSGLDYSRINALQALALLDDKAPFVELNELGCNATDLALTKAELYLWNSSGELIYYEEKNLNMTSNYGLVANISNLNYGIYYLNCKYSDFAGRSSFAEKNKSIVVSDMNVLLDIPEDNALVKGSGKHEFICNVSSNNELSYMNVSVLNASNDKIFGENKNISGLKNSSMFEISLTENGNYSWSCAAGDVLGKTSISDLRKFVYDSMKLTISAVLPINNSIINRVELGVSIDNKGVCNYVLDGVVNGSLNTTNNLSFSGAIEQVNDGLHNVRFNCLSFDGRSANADIVFTKDSIAPVVSLNRPGESEEVEEGNVEFSYGASDANKIEICKLIVDGNSVGSSNNINNGFVKPVSAGNHAWLVNCIDKAGNEGNSSLRALEVAGSSSGGSSNTGSGSSANSGSGSGESSNGESSQAEETANNIPAENPVINNEENAIETQALNNELDNGVNEISSGENNAGASSGVTGQAVAESEKPFKLTKKKVLFGALIIALILLFLAYKYSILFGKKTEKIKCGLK